MAKTKTKKSPLYWDGSQWINQETPAEAPAPEEEPKPEKGGEAGPEEEEKTE